MASEVMMPMGPSPSVPQTPRTPTTADDKSIQKRDRKKAKQEMLIKTFEPARKKLTVVESQRIINAYDDAL